MDELKREILKEHHRAELQRLEQGQAGCGCPDRQKLYESLDLSQYGDRVLYLDGFISVCATKKKGEDTGQDSTDGLPQPSVAVAKILTREILPPDDTPNTKDGIMLHRGRPRKAPDEPVHRVTEWRRRKESPQGVLL